MILGIVGSEQAKFTPDTELAARDAVKSLIDAYAPEAICSGCCHLGGVDLYAEQAAKEHGLPFIACPPKSKSWELGYKPRNIEIATKSDHVVCITVKELPPTYSGMKFSLCYHCGSKDHVKSGGCWTTKYARKLGKPGWTIVIT